MLRSDPQIHYKMYKAKKNVVYAALFSFAVLGGLGLSQNAKADTVENTNATPTVQTVANSAQPTTGATPQSMPTQSTATPQSSAADVNTVNPDPTAQPVSAQPIVNSQDDSASNVSNQTQTTTLNTQSARPARNLAVTRRARLYARSLAQNNYDQAQNVHASFSQPSRTDATHSPNSPWVADAHFDFQVNLTGHKAGDLIHIGNFTQSSDTSRRMGLRRLYYAHVSYKGSIIGDLQYSTGDPQATPLYLRLINIPNVTGLVNLSVDAPQFLQFNYNYGNNFKGVHLSHVTWQFITPNRQQIPMGVYAVKQPDLKYFDQYKNHEPIKDWYSTSNRELVNESGEVVLELSHSQFNVNELKSTLSDNNVTQPLHLLNKTYMTGYDLTSSEPILPFIRHGMIYFDIPTVNHGRYIYQDAYAHSAPAWASTIPAHQMQDRLTIAQLKALINPNTSEILYSIQDSRHIILVSNLTPDAFHIQQSSDALKTAYEGTTAVDATDDPDAAAEESMKAEQTVFQNYPTHSSLWIPYQFADPTVKSTVTLKSVDLVTNKAISTTTDTSTVNSSMAHGQAAVKLHVINATNGTELNQWSKLINEA